MSTPPPPPGFTLDPEPVKPSRAKRRTADQGVPPPPAGFTLDEPTREAVDGDTVRMENGGNLRLWGADAPEMKQQGYDRSGRPVPIGVQSRNALQIELTKPGEVLVDGGARGMSYGRPVAPLTVGGADLGHNVVRSGNALAAPQYLGSDPARRFDYVQAERLARQNRLGMHGAFVPQTPQEFRRDPDYQPAREDIAQWWDTPTPDAGLTSDVEQGYIAVARAGTVSQILDYARQHGFTLNPADVADFVAARANGAEVTPTVTYADVPKPLTDLGDGATGAAVRGIGNGVLPNFLEETGAFVDMAGLTDGRENVWNSDRRLADIWYNNYQQNEAITGFDASVHPWATTGGQVAGGVIVPIGRVKSAADLAKWGAGFGLVSGLGRDGTIPERMTSGVIGMGEGLLGTVVGGKLLEAGAPYVGKAINRLTGKGVGEAPAGILDDFSDIPEPPPGFRLDEPVTSRPETERPDVGTLPDEAGRSIAMDAEPMPSVSQDVPPPPPGFTLDRPQPMGQPLSDAQMRARASDVQPGDVVPIPSNVVGSVEEAAAIDAGRIVEAKAPNERRELTSRTVTNFMGQPVPKAGPIDLVGWLRLHGGLSDAGDAVSRGGDIAAMGLTNASRKGMDFVGQEHRFGPLVNNVDGMSLDDAAMRAWEAGYFPELRERPDVNTFLDALSETHNGGSARRFLADDLPEIDRYYGAQSNRYALEEQRFATGEPVYLDKSVPAADPAPFPPPQAYEEWPAGGPDFAGNIDLNKLDSPQDIKRALDFTHRQVGGFDAATRGRVTHAETERLASELGMTPDALLARRKGQAFNAEEAHAARQILAKSGNELVNAARKLQGMENPGDDMLADFRRKWMRHVAIQEQVSGMTAEAGRTLQQFRMAADSRAVKGNVLHAMVEGSGGGSRIQDAANVLLEAVEQGPGKFNVLAEQLAKPRFRDKAIELYYNMMLSNPSTHVVNVVSNTMTSLGQLPEHAVANVMGKGRELFNRGAVDRVTSTEIGRRTFGLMQGFKDGLRQFARTARTGETSDFITKVESQAQEAIPGKVGTVIRTPSRLLAAEDELFKAVARRMELNGLAARKAHVEGLKGDAAAKRIAELVEVPTDDMLARAFDYGRYLTFQRPLGEIAGGVARWRSADGVFGPMMTLLVPFVRTPTNLLKFAAERSPAAPLLKEWRADFRAGGARRDLAISRALVGTAFGATVYEAALNGNVSGSMPSDPVKAQFMRADGWQPYSFRVGDKWYSYQRLDPFATTIGVAADLATKADGMTKRQLDDYAMMLTASIIKNMGDKTWLSSASDFIEALSDPERYGPSYLRRMGAGLVTPAISSGAARAIDPTARDVRSLGDAVQNRIPGMSDSLPAKRNIWGEPIVNEGGFGPDFLSPMWTSTEKNDPVNAEMLKIGARFDAPDRFIKKDGQRVDLTPQQYERYAEVAGRGTRRSVEALMASPEWKGLTDDDKQARVKKAATAAKKAARSELFGADPDGPGGGPKGGSGKAVPPPPPGFRADGEAGRRA